MSPSVPPKRATESDHSFEGLSTKDFCDSTGVILELVNAIQNSPSESSFENQLQMLYFQIFSFSLDSAQPHVAPLEPGRLSYECGRVQQEKGIARKKLAMKTMKIGCTEVVSAHITTCYAVRLQNTIAGSSFSNCIRGRLFRKWRHSVFLFIVYLVWKSVTRSVLSV